jgi:hypothetical protein
MQLRQQLVRTHSFIACFLAAFALIQANHAFGQDESISLKRMGSFHTGGRLVELNGKQIKQMTFTPGGASVTATAGKFSDSIKSNGGRVDIFDLPKMGIVGNSHMLMMDKNNRQVADLIQKWLTEQGLYK